jgi:hypothetical protein
VRLHPMLVNFIAESVAAELEHEKVVSFHDDRMIVGLVENVINAEMEREAELDEEVRAILSRHYEEMRRGGLNYDEMFRKVKAQLARERGIVL